MASKFYNIELAKIFNILMSAAHGVATVAQSNTPVSDMVFTLTDLNHWAVGGREPFFVAIREHGTENGSKAHCIERCKHLGSPVIIARIEPNKVRELNMVITYNFANDVEKSFNSKDLEL